MSGKESYKQQTKLSFLQFLAELPNFIIVSISAVLTGSMIVWMDFVDSLGHFLRTCTVLFMSKYLSKDRRFKYNYGAHKLEDIAVLLCDGIVMIGLLIATFMSVYGIIYPSKTSGLMIVVVGWKLICVVVDTIFLLGQLKIYKKDKSIFAKSNVAALVASVLFDSVNFLSALLIWLFNDQQWTWYFAPIISIIIAIYLGYKCIGRLKKAISELTDKTLSEADQLKILKVLSSHDEDYTGLCSIKSHNIGSIAHIDLVITFSGEKTYKEIVELRQTLQNEISELIKDSIVSITIQ